MCQKMQPTKALPNDHVFISNDHDFDDEGEDPYDMIYETRGRLLCYVLSKASRAVLSSVGGSFTTPKECLNQTISRFVLVSFFFF